MFHSTIESPESLISPYVLRFGPPRLASDSVTRLHNGVISLRGTQCALCRWPVSGDTATPSDVSSRPMAISEFRVKGLFGAFDHRIKMNQSDRITIIHGANGVGKTTVLKMIDDIFHRRFASLKRIPFDEIVIKFDSRDELHLGRRSGDNDSDDQQGAIIEGFKRDSKGLNSKTVVISRLKEDPHIPSQYIENLIDSISRVGPAEWYDSDHDDILDMEEVVERYANQLPGVSKVKYPSWLDNLLKLDVLMIETQRLSASAQEISSRGHFPPPRPGRPGRRPSTAVGLLASDLVSQIRSSLAAYAETSQGLDRTFPDRLLSASHRIGTSATSAKIRSRYENQSTTRTKLIAAGLIDQSQPLRLPDQDLDVTERNVLWTYLDDVDEKLEVLEPISRKIDLFREVLNNKYQATGKSIHVDRQQGFVIRTEREDILELRMLSSGEQHELVLTYKLIFQVKPESLIMIDEPELSLHPAWQQVFIDDLERISQTSGLDFLLATHSPVLIGKRMERAVSLSTERS